MTNSWTAIYTWTTSAIVVWSGVMPLWLIIVVGIIGWALALLNQEELNYKTIPTYILSGAMISAGWTNFILEMFLKDNPMAGQVWILIAFFLWILWHIFVHFILENKKGIKKQLWDKIFNNNKQW
jgi:hypothetical protein